MSELITTTLNSSYVSVLILSNIMYVLTTNSIWQHHYNIMLLLASLTFIRLLQSLSFFLLVSSVNLYLWLCHDRPYWGFIACLHRCHLAATGYFRKLQAARISHKTRNIFVTKYNPEWALSDWDTNHPFTSQK